MLPKGLLLLGLTIEPTKCLGSDAEAKVWLDSVVPVYTERVGISISQRGGGAVINSEEFVKFQAEQHVFVDQ